MKYKILNYKNNILALEVKEYVSKKIIHRLFTSNMGDIYIMLREQTLVYTIKIEDNVLFFYTSDEKKDKLLSFLDDINLKNTI